MIRAIEVGKPVPLENKISRFCDGSAIPLVGIKPFDLCRKNIDKFVEVSEGKLSTTILNLYN
jgi:threonine dehydratase